jgi:flagellar hook-length control protein FliK
MEVFMAIPLLSMLGLASSAVDVVQKVFSQGNAKAGDFDAELASALNGTGGAKTPLSKLLLKNGKIDDEALKTLLGSPMGLLLFQFMTSLKELGLSSADIKLIMGGKGAQLSDEGLKTLLSKCGVGTKEIESIMSSTDLKNEIKTKLGESFQSVIKAQAARDGIDPEALFQLAAEDGTAIDDILAKLEAVSTQVTGQTAQTDKTDQTGTAEGAQHAQASPAETANTQDPLVKFTVGLVQKNASHTTSEIRAMVGQILKKVGKAESLARAGTLAAGESENTQKSAQAGVAQMTEQAQTQLGISKDELKSLFFETDPSARQEIVAQVTAKVGTFLKANEGKDLSPETKAVVSFLKTAMSESEFSSIDQSLKLYNGGQTLPELKMPLDSGTYTALAKNLGSSDAQSQFETQMKQVVDQLRQTLPAQMKDTGGQVTLRLNPPMLGKVDVSMTMTGGQLQATFKTDQLITRDMLVQNMNILKDALADQGIKATQFSVSMSFDSRQQQGENYASWTGSEQGRHGAGHQGGGQENGNRAFREEDNALYAQANYSGLLDKGLDLFA